MIYFLQTNSPLICRLYELVFHTAVAKEIKPQMDAVREKINAENIKKKEKTSKINKIEDALQKEATQKFQEKFLGPLGKGLRVFFPEPQKGGNSNTGVCANRCQYNLLKL